MIQIVQGGCTYWDYYSQGWGRVEPLYGQADDADGEEAGEEVEDAVRAAVDVAARTEPPVRLARSGGLSGRETSRAVQRAQSTSGSSPLIMTEDSLAVQMEGRGAAFGAAEELLDYLEYLVGMPRHTMSKMHVRDRA